MIDFDHPERWIILQYRPGSGGKFFCACLMTIDRITHWDPRVQHREITYQQWVRQQWTHPATEKWLAFEPMHKWHTRFFSRTFPRGNDISIQEYNKLMNQCASDYLRSVWHGNQLILDFVNQPNIPSWWQDSHQIQLDARRDCKMYKKFLLGKLYPFDPESKKGTVILDKGLAEERQDNAWLYENQCEFGPFDHEDQWYKFILENDFRLNFQLHNVDVWLTDLLDYDILLQKISAIAEDLASSFRSNDLEFVWKHWIEKNAI